MIDPPATLDTVITIEWFLGGGLALLATGLGWLFVDARVGRRRIYERLEQGFKEVRAAIKEQGDQQAEVIRDHESGCSERWREDARWKGRIEGKLGIGDGED